MILVTGATGFIGRNLVRQLMADQLPLRCLLTEQQAQQLPWEAADPHAPEIIIGTILNEETVFQAVIGVHTIIHLESAMWWGRQHALERIEITGTRTLIAAARSARVGRIITLSHIGATPASAYTLHRIKGQVEEALRTSGVAYTILRSGIVFGEEDAFINHIALTLRSNPLFFFMPGQGDMSLHPIYIDDLIRCIQLSLESMDAVDTTIEIGGPEYITFEDLLLTVMRVTGMSRLIIPLPPYLLRTISAFYSQLLPRSLITSQWLDILATNRTTHLGNVYDHFRFQPRRIEDTLLTYLPGKPHLLNLIRQTFRRRPHGL